MQELELWCRRGAGIFDPSVSVFKAGEGVFCGKSNDRANWMSAQLLRQGPN